MVEFFVYFVLKSITKIKTCENFLAQYVYAELYEY